MRLWHSEVLIPFPHPSRSKKTGSYCKAQTGLLMFCILGIGCAHIPTDLLILENKEQYQLRTVESG